MVPFVDIVLREGDASTRYKLALAGPGGDGAARRASIRRSERVAALLSERGHDDCIAQHPTRDGRARIGFSPPLADLGYQPGDMALLPLRDQVLEWLLDEPRRRPADDVY